MKLPNIFICILKKIRSILWWIVGVIVATIIGIIVVKLINENSPQLYVAVLITEKSIDFAIPKDFNKGFDNNRCFKSKDNKRIDIKIEDDFLSESKSERIIKKLVNDENCLLIVCNANSTLTNANIDLLISMGAKIPIIMPIATDNNIMKKADDAEFKAILQMLPNNSVQAKTVQSFLFQNYDKRRVAIYSDEDNQSYSINLSKDIAEKIRKNGGYVIIEELLGPSNSIFNSLRVLENKALQPDLIIYAGTSHYAYLLIDQLSTLNLKIPLILTDGCLDATIFQQASLKYENNCYILSPALLKNETSYLASYALIGEDTHKLLENIISSTVATRIEISNYIENYQKEISFEGSAGSYKFEDGENIGRDYYIYQILGGKTQLVPVY